MNEKVAKKLGWTTFVGTNTGVLYYRRPNCVINKWDPQLDDNDALLALDVIREKYRTLDVIITESRYLIETGWHCYLSVNGRNVGVGHSLIRSEAICKAILALPDDL